MCTRYISPDQADIERAWHLGRHNQPSWWAKEVFPRSLGPFLRQEQGGENLELVVGSWALIPGWAKAPILKYSTCNCRSEEAAGKPTFADVWRKGQRCIIPANSFDEPCWETGKHVWWRFRRRDGLPWGLAGLWNTWTDRATGEIIESYTMLTVNADDHPIMNRMHKPNPKLPADRQDKRSVIAIEPDHIRQWLQGSAADARALLVAPALDVLEANPT